MMPRVCVQMEGLTKYKEMIRLSGKVVKAEDDGCAFVSFVRKVLYSELYTGKVSIYSKENGNATESGYLEIKPSGEWQRVWVHFRLSADWTDATGKNFNIGVFGGNGTGNSIRAQFRRPKLEACAAMTEYTDAQADYIEDENISKKLRRTGIDITTERITLDAKMAPGRAPWREAETAVKEIIPMFKLTVDGLNQAMTVLMTQKR